ncbi:CDP-alcohol phosphatidyltransferase family protein [Fodinicola feengrottensis]|uniref:CDP-alcohol phosphatidyltransferase family protein n=1 Tax=Fodinicola feengrottensis TaxID=435914 RepID=UPI002441F8AF|nr:CDP-alcohol phosphatidyltransferase family protein [Fodinicola feengrottensis]
MTTSEGTGFRDALRRLPAAQKSAKGAPAYSRFVNRKLGRYLAAFAYRVRMSPNQVTIISALFSFAAIAMIALVRPSLPMGIAVCLLLLVIGYALDSADGQLARLTGRGSRAGEWLDHFVDSAKIVTLHAAVLVSFYRFFALPPALLLIPLVFCCVATVLFFGG